ncbi:MAG: hypothetical protein R3C11_24920 [Planctomycetaceae bacterium]
MRLAIENRYGNVDLTRQTSTKRYVRTDVISCLRGGRGLPMSGMHESVFAESGTRTIGTGLNTKEKTSHELRHFCGQHPIQAMAMRSVSLLEERWNRRVFGSCPAHVQTDMQFSRKSRHFFFPSRK